MIGQRSFIAVVSGSILVVPFAIVAQQRSKTHRIGLLSPPGAYVVNLKTAKALGLTIPQTLLLRADQVIE